jgi:hypothetical protein
VNLARKENSENNRKNNLQTNFSNFGVRLDGISIYIRAMQGVAGDNEPDSRTCDKESGIYVASVRRLQQSWCAAPAASVCCPSRLTPPRAWAAASSSYGHCLVELGSSSPSATAPALPAAPSTSASPTVKSHRSVALAARPDCRSCAAACCRPPVLPSAFTGRRPAALLLAGRPEVCCCR